MWPEDWWQVCNNALMWTNSVTGGWLVASVNWSTRVYVNYKYASVTVVKYTKILKIFGQNFYVWFTFWVIEVSPFWPTPGCYCPLPRPMINSTQGLPQRGRMFGTKQFLDFRRDTMEDETFQKLYALRTYQWHFYWCCLQTQFLLSTHLHFVLLCVIFYRPTACFLSSHWLQY